MTPVRTRSRLQQDARPLLPLPLLLKQESVLRNTLRLISAVRCAASGAIARAILWLA